MTDKDDRRRWIEELEAQGLRVTEWHDDPQASYEEHSHPTREVRIVLSGGMTISAGGIVHVLGPGDRLDIDPGELHSALVGPDGVNYLAATGR